MKKIIHIDYNKIFTPELSPKEMLELGVFGGYYFKNDFLEFPKSWFKNAKISADKFDVNMNYFNISNYIWSKNYITICTLTYYLKNDLFASSLWSISSVPLHFQNRVLMMTLYIQ